MQLLRILSNNMTHGSNITDKGAIVGARGALVGNFVMYLNTSLDGARLSASLKIVSIKTKMLSF